MKKHTALLLCGVLFLTIGLSAGANDPKEEKQVIATMEAMAQATVKHDMTALGKVLHEDLMYSHSGGRLMGKAELLTYLGGPAGLTEYEKFSDTTIHIYGSVALFRGVTDLRATGGSGKMHDNHLNVLWVLVKGPGPHGWQVVARQVTPLGNSGS